MASPVRIARIRADHKGRRLTWNRSRVNQLCQLLQITDKELVAYLDWEQYAFRRAYTTNTFPGPVCIVLELMEAHAKKIMLGEKADFDLPFPSKLT